MLLKTWHEGGVGSGFRRCSQDDQVSFDYKISKIAADKTETQLDSGEGKVINMTKFSQDDLYTAVLAKVL